MSVKKIGEVKADRGFKIFDLIIYGIIAVLVAVLFITVFTTRNDSPLKGIRVYAADEVLFEYSFETDEYNIPKEGAAEVVSDNDETLIIMVYTDGGGYNEVKIDKSGSVTVTDANCSARADCVFSPAIKDSGGGITCLPHRLRIVPFDFDPDSGNIQM